MTVTSTATTVLKTCSNTPCQANAVCSAAIHNAPTCTCLADYILQTPNCVARSVDQQATLTVTILFNRNLNDVASGRRASGDQAALLDCLLAAATTVLNVSAARIPKAKAVLTAQLNTSFTFSFLVLPPSSVADPTGAMLTVKLASTNITQAFRCFGLTGTLASATLGGYTSTPTNNSGWALADTRYIVAAVVIVVFIVLLLVFVVWIRRQHRSGRKSPQKKG